MIPFPSIAEVEDGQVLGAGQLNAYKSACEYLLAESHAPVPLNGQLQEYSTYSTDEGNTVWCGYLYHWTDTLHYRLRGRENGGGAGDSWNAGIDYYGDDSAWHTLVTVSGQNDWSNRTGTVSLAGASMTKGKVYQLRVRLWCGDDDHNSFLQIWMIAERGDGSGVWVTPPTFSAGVSSAAALNSLRTDLLALYEHLVSPINALTAIYTTDPRIEGDGDTNYHRMYVGAYRYRPEKLSLGIYWYLWSTKPGRWRVIFGNTAGNEATIYTSAEIQGVPNGQWSMATLDLTEAGIAAALAAAGITLTRGNYYRVSLEIRKAEGTSHVLTVDGAYMVRLSSGTPAAGWQALQLWAHGDTDVSHTELNKFSTDLMALYTAGVEALFGESGAVMDHQSMHVISGRHRKRYLNYCRVTGRTPTIYYGVGFADSFDLPTGDGWRYYDLAETQLPWGGAYLLEDASCAFESDGVVANAQA